eukprot:UN33243
MMEKCLSNTKPADIKKQLTTINEQNKNLDHKIYKKLTVHLWTHFHFTFLSELSDLYLKFQSCDRLINLIDILHIENLDKTSKRQVLILLESFLTINDLTNENIFISVEQTISKNSKKLDILIRKTCKNR